MGSLWKWAVLATAGIVVACSSMSSKRAPASGKKLVKEMPHVVFLIHGFRDDGHSFQQLPEVIIDEFGAKNFRVKKLFYPSVGESAHIQKRTALDFAKIINTQIISFLVEEHHRDINSPEFEFENPVGLDTPYSIVAHSQGGLVSMNFFNSCFLTTHELSEGKRDRCNYGEGIEQLQQLGMDNFIRQENLLDHALDKGGKPTPFGIRNFLTLGTPFWGSAVANSAQNKGWFLKLAKKILPEVQLENLAIGSRTLTMNHIWMLDREATTKEENWTESTKWVSRYPLVMRVWNVGGSLGPLLQNDPNWNFAGTLAAATSPLYFEHDGFVAAPEARADFIYFVENRDPQKPALRGRTRFTGSFIPLKLAHMGDFGYLGLAGITFENRNKHPVMKLIRQLLNEAQGFTRNHPEWTPQEKEEFVVEKLANFTSEIKLVTPVGYHRRFQIKAEDINVAAQEPSFFDALRLPGSIPFWSEAQNKFALQVRDHFYQTYYHIGRFKDEFALKPREETLEAHFKRRAPYQLNYEIKVMGFKKKNFFVHVMPSMASYSEVYLTPDLPIAASSLNQVLSMMNQNCRVGIVGEEPYPEDDRVNYLTPTRRTRQKIWPKNYYFRTFDQEPMEQGEAAKVGEAVEILGRVGTGFIDRVSGLHRPCTETETDAKTPGCETPGRDRYLITSRSIRRQDGVKNTLELSPQRGVRWVDVTTVDIPESFPYRRAEGSGAGHATNCLGDDRSKQYLVPGQYQKYFYGKGRI